ncbi:hypothetical protein [uncultured Paracoccus sp.]|uniref:hypothetical protein n=1 Tax=uncultured Paracoccus sp. TaxID=189685 RepID=UPI0026102666|nr:hypothetical protein [uncultured Paracoccus sp.]
MDEAARTEGPEAARDNDRARQMAIRAIIDGRGAELAVLTSSDSICWLTGRRADDASGMVAVIVTASRCVPVTDWAQIARGAGQGRPVAVETGALGADGLAAIRAALAPARIVCIAADTARLCAPRRDGTTAGTGTTPMRGASAPAPGTTKSPCRAGRG